ncbi:MAG: hypothetical protein ACLQVM_27435, partial [Terriglobia bacterium]
NPHYTNALNNRGVVYLEQGHYDQALADFQLSEAKNLALSVFKAMRDPSSPAAPQDDSPKEFFRSL